MNFLQNKLYVWKTTYQHFVLDTKETIFISHNCGFWGSNSHYSSLHSSTFRFLDLSRERLRSTDTAERNASPHGTYRIRVSLRYSPIRVSLACPDFSDLKEKKRMPIRGRDGGDTPGTREEPRSVEPMANPNPTGPVLSLAVYSFAWQGPDRAPPLLLRVDITRRCSLESRRRRWNHAAVAGIVPPSSRFDSPRLDSPISAAWSRLQPRPWPATR